MDQAGSRLISELKTQDRAAQVRPDKIGLECYYFDKIGLECYYFRSKNPIISFFEQMLFIPKIWKSKSSHLQLPRWVYDMIQILRWWNSEAVFSEIFHARPYVGYNRTTTTNDLVGFVPMKCRHLTRSWFFCLFAECKDIIFKNNASCCCRYRLSFIILIFFFNAQNRIQKNTIQAAICSVHDWPFSLVAGMKSSESVSTEIRDWRT
jgi:hypothetical protein